MKTGELNFRFERLSANGRAEELSALDELFIASRRYRSSKEYMELLDFVGKFRRYAPFNCILMHIQNPDVTYVASIKDWKEKFNRYPKRNARPLVILQPFGQVMFLYDVEDTEGDPVPQSVLKPFDTVGTLPSSILSNVIKNCTLHSIHVRYELKGLYSAGKAIKMDHEGRQRYVDLGLSPAFDYLILLNTKHSVEEKYSTIAHELGHIFCGHPGIGLSAWWDSNISISSDAAGIEAESVAYLICKRRGLKSASERYLSRYRTPENIEMPFFSLNAVFQAVDYIEKMGEMPWKSPRRKPKKQNILEYAYMLFSDAWTRGDYKTIIAVADKIPKNVLEENSKLMMWYDLAITRSGEEV